MATEVTKIVDPDNGAGTDYTSLAALVAGYAKDLVTADEQLTVKCRCTGGTADGAVTVNGFTTDATRFIKIWTDPSESYRHAGTYPSGNKYRIEGSGSGSTLQLSDNNIYIIGVAIGVTVTTTSQSIGVYASSVTSGARHHISQCYIKLLSRSSTGTPVGIRILDSDVLPYFYNTTVCGFINEAGTSGYGIHLQVSGTSRIFNCTLFGNYIGLYRESGTSYATNTISANNADDFNGTITIDYCASDDGDGTNAVDISPGATEADDWAEVFTDYANGDFSLKNFTGTQKVIGMGVDDPGSGLYSDDILGNARSSVWDIGAFEYVASGGGTSVTLSTGTLALTGQIPTISATANQSITAGKGALSLTGYAPTVSVSNHISVAALLGQLSVTGKVPTVAATAHVSAAPAKGELTVTGKQPTVSATGHQSVVPGKGELILTGKQVTVSTTADQAVTPSTGALTLTGKQPTAAATGSQSVVVPSGALLFTGKLPTVTATASANVTPGLGSLALVGKVPTAIASDHKLAAPATGALALTGQTPTVSATAHVVASPIKGVLLVAGYAPTPSTTADALVTPSTGTLAVTGHAPSVVSSSALTICPGCGSLVLTGKAPFIKGYLISWTSTCAPLRLRGADDRPVILYGTNNTPVRLIGK
jgi:hypothetical protein